MQNPGMDSQTFHEYAYHLLQSGDREKLYALLSDEGLLRTHVEKGDNYAFICEALQYGLQAYLNGSSVEHDTRLCFLALQTARLATQDRHDMSRTLAWAREGRVDETLDRLLLLSDENFYKSVLLLLWNEALRQKSLPPEKTNSEQARRLWQEIEKHLGERPIAWEKWLPEEFLVAWSFAVFPLLSLEQISKTLKRGGEIESDRVLSRLSCCFSGDKQFSESLVVAGNVVSDWQKYQTLLAIARDVCQEPGNHEKIFEEFLAISDKMASDWDKYHTLASLAHLVVQHQNTISGRLALLEKMIIAAYHIESSLAQCETFAQIATAFARIGDKEAAGQLLEETLAAVEKIKAADARCSALAVLAQAWGDLGDREKSRQVLGQALLIGESLDEDYRDEAISAIAQTLAQADDVPAAMQLVKHVEDEAIKSKVLLGITEFLVRHKNFARALEIIPSIRMEQTKSEALIVIAQALTQAGDLEQALSFVPHDDNQAVVLAEIVRTLLTMDEVKNALEIAKRILHIPTRQQAIANVMAHLVEQGRLSFALNVATQLASEEEAYALLQIAVTLQKSGQPEDSKGVLAKTMAMVVKWPLSRNKVQILATLARCHSSVCDHDKAKELFVQALKTGEAIKDREERSEALMRLIEELVQSPQLADRLFLLEKALNQPQVLEEELRKCLVLLDDLHNMGTQSDIIAQLALCERNWENNEPGAYTGTPEWQDNVWESEQGHDFSGDLDYLQGMENEYEKSFALSALVQLLAMATEIADKDGLFDRAIMVAGSIGDERYKAASLSAVIQALIESRETTHTGDLLTQVMAVAASLEEDWHKFSVLAVLAQGWAQTDDFSQALHIAEIMPDRGWQCEALSAVALVFAAKGKREEVNRVLVKIMEIGNGLELNWHKEYSFSSLTQALSQVGEFTQALNVAQMIESDWNKSEALSAVAQAMARAGKISHALTITQQITADADKLAALCAISDHLRDDENVPQRRMFFAQGLEAAATIADRRCLYKALTNIADAMARTGELELLPAFFQQHRLPPECLQGIVESWQKALLKYLDNPLPALRHTLAISPFDYRLVCHGITMLQLCHWRLGNSQHYEAIEEVMREFMDKAS
jgi:tetratricopeptide (TPR) repeat protein